MKLVQSFLTRNPCYTAGRKITVKVKGLMLHSVGCPQPRASVFINSWNRADFTSACVHGFIDGNDGTVYQTLPWDHRGWHCGSGSKGSGNDSMIGVEMCEPACIKYTSGANFICADTAAAKAVAKRTYLKAEGGVALFAMLGVTSNGMKGNSFDTPQLGIRAQIQHLKAYASKDALKNECIDPPFQVCHERQCGICGMAWAAGRTRMGKDGRQAPDTEQKFWSS